MSVDCLWLSSSPFLIFWAYLLIILFRTTDTHRPDQQVGPYRVTNECPHSPVLFSQLLIAVRSLITRHYKFLFPIFFLAPVFCYCFLSAPLLLFFLHFESAAPPMTPTHSNKTTTNTHTHTIQRGERRKKERDLVFRYYTLDLLWKRYTFASNERR